MRIFAVGLGIMLTAGIAATWEAPVILYEQAPVVPTDSIPAFAGALGNAEGHGALALATCRSLPLQVIEVTNTNATGSGSLSDAVLNRAHPDSFSIVVFRVGGAITNAPDLGTGSQQNCLYVAGQTAPGQGIGLQRTGDGSFIHTSWGSGTTQDMVIRYLRFHSTSGGTSEVSQLRVRGGTRMIFDHLSIAFTNDSWWSVRPINADIRDVTISNTLQCSSVSTAWEITLHTANEMDGISFHHLYGCHARHRFPQLGTASGSDTITTLRRKNLEWVSTLSYKRYSSRMGGFRNNLEIDLRDNLLRNESNPSSSSQYWRWEQQDCQNPHPVVASIYMDGNKNASGTPREDWDLMRDNCANTDAVPDSVKRFTPIPAPYWPITATPADSLPAVLLPTVGVSRLLACDGSVRTTGVRIALDSIFTTDYTNGTGPTDGQTTADYGGLPSITGGTACTDTDEDGIPDEWELAVSGSTTGVRADSVTTSGYLMIEHYLNGSDPDDAEPWGEGAAPTPPDPEEPPPPITQTFGDGSRVYLVPLAVRGVAWRYTLVDSVPVDSVLVEVMGPDTTVVPIPTHSVSLRPQGGDQVLVCTPTDLGTPLDSATVHGIMESWFTSPALRTAVYLRDRCP